MKSDLRMSIHVFFIHKWQYIVVDADHATLGWMPWFLIISLGDKGQMNFISLSTVDERWVRNVLGNIVTNTPLDRWIEIEKWKKVT